MSSKRLVSTLNIINMKVGTLGVGLEIDVGRGGERLRSASREKMKSNTSRERPEEKEDTNQGLNPGGEAKVLLMVE